MGNVFPPTCRIDNKFHLGKFYTHCLFYEDVQDILRHVLRVANQAGLEGHKFSELEISKLNEKECFILECDCE